MSRSVAAPRTSWKGSTGLVILATWTVFGLWSANMYLLGSIATGRPVESWTRPILQFVAGSWQWALYTPFLIALARRAPVVRGRLRRSVAMHAAAFLVVMLLDSVLDIYVQALISASTRSSLISQFFSMMQVNLMFYVATYFVARLVDSQRELRRREVSAAQLEARLAHAELEALRAQLHPHFLFNTLNTIASLMRRDVDAAETMLARLGDLLRMALERGGAQEVAVAEEVAFVERYLAVEQIRFSDRLTTVIDVAPGVSGASIPHFLLQPLVENAIRHGIALRERGGSVLVRIGQVQDRLRCEILDDGVGPPEVEDERRWGVGLRNTRARLQQLYGDHHRFALERRAEGGARALVEIPYRRAAA